MIDNIFGLSIRYELWDKKAYYLSILRVIINSIQHI